MASGLDLSKQLGPLPMGAWIVIVGAGVGIAYSARGNSPSSPVSTIVTDTSPTPGVGEGGTADFIQTSAPVVTNKATTYDTNEAWSKAAIDWLIGNGYPPAIAYSGIAKALAGSELSVSEYAIWQAALRGLGSPPQTVEVVPPTGGVGGTVTPVENVPAPPAVGFRYYLITHNQSWGVASRAVYGTPDGWRLLRDANSRNITRADGTKGFVYPTAGQHDNVGIKALGKRLIVPPR